VRHEDIPDINNPKTIKDVLEGDKLIKEVLNGGYNLGSLLKLFTLGYTTSGDP
jgi:hypothetical protein